MLKVWLNRDTQNQTKKERNTINTHGIGETAKRQMKRPSRARVIVARLDGFLASGKGALVIFIALALALTSLISLAISQQQTGFISVFACVSLVVIVLGAIGGLLLIDETKEQNAKWWRAYTRDTIRRQDSAHELALGKLSKQLLDERAINETNTRNRVNTYKRKTDELNALVNKIQLGAHNLAYALVEDNDIREHIAYALTKIANEIPSNERAQVFANLELYDYARDGVYGYDARLNTKLENGLADWANFNRDRD